VPKADATNDDDENRQDDVSRYLRSGRSSMGIPAKSAARSPEALMAATRGKITLWQHLSVTLGLVYQCRCGALVKPAWRASHERFHDAMREFCAPPTPAEFAAVRTGAAASSEQPF
jgi:hypothetical protein